MCGAEAVTPLSFGATTFAHNFVGDFQSRSCYLIDVAIWLWLLERTIVIVPEVQCSETAETPLCCRLLQFSPPIEMPSLLPLSERICVSFAYSNRNCPRVLR